MTQAEACRLHIIKSCLELLDPLFPAGQETQMRQDPPLIQPKMPQILPTPAGQPSSNLLTPAPGTRQRWQRSSQSTEMGWTSFFWKFSPAVLPLHLQLKLGWTVSVKDDAEKVFVWLGNKRTGYKNSKGKWVWSEKFSWIPAPLATESSCAEANAIFFFFNLCISASKSLCIYA